MDCYHSQAKVNADRYDMTPKNRQSPLACDNCLEHKTVCNPLPGGQKHSACERCARKALRCEFAWEKPSHKSNDAIPTTSRTTQHVYSEAPLPPPASHPVDPSKPLVIPGRVPKLPYTGPPPSFSAPRYADGRYPDLRLDSDSSSSLPTTSTTPPTP
ncbi:unnamed protein product, partial [Mycena citricolor]